MKVVITGGGGMLGLKLARAVLARGRLTASDGQQSPITAVVLFDTAFPNAVPQDARVRCVTGDITAPGALQAVITPDTQSIFHLASVVSAGAEADFDLGWRVNLDGTRAVLEHARACAQPPRLVFTSSVAVFGGSLPAVLDDSTTPHPQSSYGAQKACCETLITDYSRKSFIDGRSVRLPTIVVRPGKPNLAASSFASGVLREPLNGVLAECPVEFDTGIWLMSPRRAIASLLHAHETPAAVWGTQRALSLPGITVTVAQMVEALARIAGAETSARVVCRPDPRIQAIVNTWPSRFITPRAEAMGFEADVDIDTVIRQYLEDEAITSPDPRASTTARLS